MILVLQNMIYNIYYKSYFVNITLCIYFIIKLWSFLQIQRGSGGALLNVSHIDTHAEQLLVCGVCASLHHFLVSGDPHLLFYAAATLSNLSVQVTNLILRKEPRP